MRYLIIITLHLISLPAFTQTSYADFIQFDNKIQWAAMYDQILDITQPIRKYGIRQILFQQMQKKGSMDNFIINKNNVAKYTISKDAALPVIDSFADNRDPFRPFTYASPENEAEYIMKEKQCFCDGNTGNNKLDIYRIKQLLYYKNSKMYVKNILVTPVCLKRSVTDGYHSQFVWQYAFSSCFNELQDSLTADQKKKCIDLGNAEQIYDLRYDFTSDSSKAEVFTLKAPSFTHHLYEDIVNSKVTVVDDQYKIIPNKKYLNINWIVLQ